MLGTGYAGVGALRRGEMVAKRWLAGSSHYRQSWDSTGPLDNDVHERFVHVAITYDEDAKKTQIYRDGKPYGTTGTKGVKSYDPDSGTITFGQRHFHGHVNDGRCIGGAMGAVLDCAALYDRALTKDEIMASFQQGCCGKARALGISSIGCDDCDGSDADKGRDCGNKINECESQDCSGNGMCTDGIDKYTCMCEAGWEGKDCEKNLCEGRDCGNGECANGVCQCDSGWEGKDCKKNIDDCAVPGTECNYNGKCTDKINGYTCTCDEGFEGKDCEIDVDDCKGQDCSEHGDCQDNINGFYCNCNFGWTGDLCDKPTECSGGPDGKQCRNRGKPIGTTGSCKCLCPAGYTGAHCETDIDECDGQDCSSAGRCVDEVNGYSCVCTSGRSGKNCEISTTSTSTSSTTSTSSSTTTSSSTVSTTTIRKCNPGERLNPAGNTCEKCPENSYRPNKEHSYTECISHTPCSGTEEYVVDPGSSTTPLRCMSKTKCTQDQFESSSDGSDGNRECTELTKCMTGQTYETTAPTSTTDRVCSSLTDCRAGQFVEEMPTPTSDRICGYCDPDPPSYQWSTRRNQPKCAEHRFCGQNQLVSRDGTMTEDLRCGRCPQGQFQPSYEHREWRCQTKAPTAEPTREPTTKPTVNPTEQPDLTATLTLPLEYDLMQQEELEIALSTVIGEQVDLKDTKPTNLKYNFEPGSIIVTVSRHQTPYKISETDQI